MNQLVGMFESQWFIYSVISFQEWRQISRRTHICREWVLISESARKITINLSSKDIIIFIETFSFKTVRTFLGKWSYFKSNCWLLVIFWQVNRYGNAWSSLVEGDEGCIGPSGTLAVVLMTNPNKLCSTCMGPLRTHFTVGPIWLFISIYQRVPWANLLLS